MNKLGQLLAARGWITVQQLNRALQNQGVVGGRVGTCLLEMEAISEENLLKGLSEHMGVPAVSMDDLRGIPDEVLGLIPDKIARRCRAVPFRVVGSRLDVAMVDPRNLAALDEIAFASSKRINVHVANELRILEALERYYRDEMPSRLSLLVERLNRARYFWERDKPVEPEPPPGLGDIDLAPLGPQLEAGPPRRARVPAKPTAAPPAPVLKAPAAPPPPPPAAPVAVAEAPARPAPPRRSIQTVTMTEEERAALAVRPKPDARPPAPAAAAEAPPEKPTPASLPSPDSAAEVEAALAKTFDREEVARLVLGFVARSYSRAALFQVGKERISAWMGQGEMDIPIFQKFSVGFDQPSLFLNLRQGSSMYIGPLPPMPAHRELARAWGGELPHDCILLPVRIKDRAVAILYADGGTKSGKGGIGGIDLSQLQAVAVAAGAALERCILHRKRAEAK
jgi:Type II secretion system (T2SS), protein E, N-terminal domain